MGEITIQYAQKYFHVLPHPSHGHAELGPVPPIYSIRRGNLGSVHRTPGDRNPEASSKETLGLLAEGVGFEPTVRKRTTVFEGG